MAVAEKKAKKSEKKDRWDELKTTIDQIHKDEGDEALKLGLNSGIMKCEVISTRCIALDDVLGVGGLPRGRIIEIFGPESSGKTTLALTVVAEAQRLGGVAAYIDTENALDPEYAEKIGVNLDNLLFSQPDYGEQAMRICEKLVESNKIDIIVVDSVAALVPKAELEGEIGDAHVAGQARLMSQSLRKISGPLRKSKAVLIFINQMRDKIGISMPGASNESTPGGRALKFYCSVRLDIRRIGSTKVGDVAVGNQVKVKVTKNKVAPPFRIANFEIVFGKGCNTAGSIIDEGVKHGLVKKNGSNYAYGENKMGASHAKACEWLEQYPEFMKEIDAKLREIIFSKNTETTPIAPDGEDAGDAGVQEVGEDQ